MSCQAFPPIIFKIFFFKFLSLIITQAYAENAENQRSCMKKAGIFFADAYFITNNYKTKLKITEFWHK